jgi:hypothetical protein
MKRVIGENLLMKKKKIELENDTFTGLFFYV